MERKKLRPNPKMIVETELSEKEVQEQIDLEEQRRDSDAPKFVIHRTRKHYVDKLTTQLKQDLKQNESTKIQLLHHRPFRIAPPFIFSFFKNISFIMRIVLLKSSFFYAMVSR